MSLGVMGNYVTGIFKASKTSEVLMTVVLRRYYGSNLDGPGENVG